MHIAASFGALLLSFKPIRSFPNSPHSYWLNSIGVIATQQLTLIMLIIESFKDIPTPTGSMRIHIFEPALPGKFAAIAVFTEIYQVTGPIERICRQLAGEGFIVASPESYHEFEAPGTAIPYDTEGTDRGNKYKITKPVASYDSDVKPLYKYFESHESWNGRIGTFGVCLGGHLAARAACEPEVSAGVFFFATDIHSRSLGEGKKDDTLDRLKSMKGEGLFLWGKQDGHVSREGRQLIYNTLMDANVNFSWVEVNAQHAFIRDEYSKGRYDPAITRCLMQLALELFQRRLTLGLPDQRTTTGSSSRT